MTEDIIKDLYFGRLSPYDQIILADPEYHEASRAVDEARQALLDRLTPDLADRFGKLEDLQIRPAALDSYASFRHGLCMGLALMRGVAEELG